MISQLTLYTRAGCHLCERVEDLLEVAGIGPSRLAQLEPLVSV